MPELQRADNLAGGLRRLLVLGTQLGHQLQVLIIARTDGIGIPSFNEQLAVARSFSARNFMVQRGLPETLFQLQTIVAPGGLLDPNLRRVEFHLRVAPARTSNAG